MMTVKVTIYYIFCYGLLQLLGRSYKYIQKGWDIVIMHSTNFAAKPIAIVEGYTQIDMSDRK